MDDDEGEIFIGLGHIGALSEKASKPRKKSNPIGFINFGNEDAPQGTKAGSRNVGSAGRKRRNSNNQRKSRTNRKLVVRS